MRRDASLSKEFERPPSRGVSCGGTTQTIDAVLDEVRRSSIGDCYHWLCEGHRFKENEPKPFSRAWKRQIYRH